VTTVRFGGSSPSAPTIGSGVPSRDATPLPSVGCAQFAFEPPPRPQLEKIPSPPLSQGESNHAWLSSCAGPEDLVRKSHRGMQHHSLRSGAHSSRSSLRAYNRFGGPIEGCYSIRLRAHSLKSFPHLPSPKGRGIMPGCYPERKQRIQTEIPRCLVKHPVFRWTAKLPVPDQELKSRCFAALSMTGKMYILLSTSTYTA